MERPKVIASYYGLLGLPGSGDRLVRCHGQERIQLVIERVDAAQE